MNPHYTEECARVFIVLKIDATFPGCLDSCDIGKPSCLDSCDIGKPSCLDSFDIGKPSCLDSCDIGKPHEIPMVFVHALDRF